MPNVNYVNYLLTKHHLSLKDYDAFNVDEGIKPLIVNSIFAHEIDYLKPYLFTLSLQTPKQLDAFKIYLTVYLVKAGLFENLDSSKEFDSIYTLMMHDGDFLICTIACMQYYFI